jgi:hypothetical protein
MKIGDYVLLSYDLFHKENSMNNRRERLKGCICQIIGTTDTGGVILDLTTISNGLNPSYKIRKGNLRKVLINTENINLIPDLNKIKFFHNNFVGTYKFLLDNIVN